MTKYCMNCRYFTYTQKWPEDEISNESVGLCCFYPPVPLSLERSDSEQPEVRADNWCGQHSAGDPRIVPKTKKS